MLNSPFNVPVKEISATIVWCLVNRLQDGTTDIDQELIAHDVAHSLKKQHGGSIDDYLPMANHYMNLAQVLSIPDFNHVT